MEFKLQILDFLDVIELLAVNDYIFIMDNEATWDITRMN